MQQPPGGVSDTAAYLQGRALAPGASAPQMGQDRRHKDHRHQQHRHIFSEMHRLNYGVGVLSLHLCHPVQPRNDNAQHRQQIQHPGMGQPRLGSVVHADVEHRPNDPADAADESPHRQPLAQHRRICADMYHELFPLVHPVPSFPGDPPKFSLFYTIFAPPCQSPSMHFSPEALAAAPTAARLPASRNFLPSVCPSENFLDKLKKCGFLWLILPTECSILYLYES